MTAHERTILIAGATGNVGGGAAAALAGRGVDVVLIGRDPTRLEARAAAIRTGNPGGPSTETMTIDFADMESVRMAAAEALDRFPAIDGLVLSVVALVQGGPNLLPSGHELMFATNVMGPFLFTQLLLDRLRRSKALVVHVVAPFHEDIDWDDLESIEHHATTAAYNRTKTMTRMVAGESARRFPDDVSTVAFNPPFVIDKTDPALKEKWPKGFLGLFWHAMTAVAAKPPRVAGEQLADVMLSYPDRLAINGVHFKRGKRVPPDEDMGDIASGQRLWWELVRITGAPEWAGPGTGGR